MKSKAGKKSRRFGERLGEYIRSAQVARLLISVIGVAAVVALFVIAIVPVRYNLQVGTVPPSTIAATKDVVDELGTEQRREEAAAQVPPTYRFQEGVTEAVMADFDQIFAQLRAVHQYGATLPDPSANRNYTKEELQYAREMLTLLPLGDYQITWLLRSSQQDLEDAYTLLYAALQSTMQGHVTEGQENTAISNIRQIVNYRISVPLGQYIVPAVLNACVRANMLIDQEATEAAREAAREAVEPVMYKQGQNIVVRGEGRITENQLAMLSTLGLLSGSDVDMTIYLGAALLVVLVMCVMLVLLRKGMDSGILKDTPMLLLMFVVLVLSLLLSMVARMANVYFVPVILCALLMTALLGLRAGLVCNMALTVLVAALAAGGSEEYAEIMAILLVTGLLSGTVAALMMKQKTTRLWVLLSGLTASAVDAAAIIAIGLMTDSGLKGALVTAAWKSGGSLLATLLCIGLQPLLEGIFNLPTPMKLMELSNPNNPLLRRLLLEAPGTYHHSTIVANLAEAAAEAIGANPLLARVGGYYHDIGKLKRPLFFAENQLGGINAHDHTDPYVSAAIVTAHTRDGVALAKQYRLPLAVQHIIAEHHGDTPVMFFYHKALQMADGKPVDISAFRYDGRHPQTKEGAIVMLCDTIEAAVRTMKNPTTDGIEEFIVKLVRGKLEDGQLNDCPLTLRDIDRICAAATQVLLGVFHERIEYPDLDELQAKIALQPDLEVQEAALDSDFPVVVQQTGAGELPTVELSAGMKAPVVTPETPAAWKTVAPPPTAKVVAIDELMDFEPLPTKEMEKELLQKIISQKDETAESGGAEEKK